jgi:poly(hydroxyalkanoate) depolymerase family esterase
VHKSRIPRLRPLSTVLVRLAVLGLVVALAAAPDASAATAAEPAGTTTVHTYASSTGLVHYRVFTPSGVAPGQHLPMVVVIHGCGLSAAQEEGATLFDDVAEREKFLVLYPDNDDLVHPAGCWQFYNVTAMNREQGDLATIAGMTNAVIGANRVEVDRVYAIGTSSGGLITSNLGASYPDLYTAIGLMAGGPYGPPLCMTGLIAPGSTASAAQAALEAEGSRQRVIPFVVLNGDADRVVSPACGEQAAQQWTRTNNLVLSGSQSAPIAAAQVVDHDPAVPGGYPYRVTSFATPSGCVLGLHYLIHGMGHGWSGGSTSPTYATTTNPLVAASRPLGPSAAEASWDFFSRFTQRTPTQPCAS